MTNNQDNKPKKQNSSTPLLIIGAVLVVAIAGIWWLYSSAKTPQRTANRSTNSTQNRSNTPATTSEAGAQPPNMLGAPTAAVTIEEFADFQCGSCAATHPVLKAVQQAYGNRIKFIFRNYPLAIPAHDKAYDAAVAAEAAGLQGKFWAMQDEIFRGQQRWTSDSNYKKIWAEYAAKIGLDVAKWEADMAGRAAKERVDADLARGRGLQVNSTPTIFINGISIPYQQMNEMTMRQLIDAELAKAAAQTSSSPAGQAPAASPSGSAQ